MLATYPSKGSLSNLANVFISAEKKKKKIPAYSQSCHPAAFKFLLPPYPEQITSHHQHEKAVAMNLGDQNDLLQPGCHGPLSTNTESLTFSEELLQEFGQQGLRFKCRKVKKNLEWEQDRDNDCPVIGTRSPVDNGCRVK